MIIQSSIEQILSSHKDSREKYEELKIFLQKGKNLFFCDFDDTITKNSCLLYSKFKYLQQGDKQIPWEKLIEDFEINETFIQTIQNKKIKEIIIISRNNLQLIKKIIQQKSKLFKNINLEIVGIIASTANFSISKNKKKYILPVKSTYIGDIFEYSTFKKTNGFICLDNKSVINYIYISCKKTILYLIFILKNV